MRTPPVKRQSGTATIEFALTAPLLVLLMLAVAELGWAFNQYITLIKAVRDGSRYAAAHALAGSTGVIDLSAELISDTRDLVVYGRPGGTTALLPDWGTDQVSVATADDDHIQVSASYPYTPIAVSVLPFTGSDGVNLGFTLRTTMVVRAL